MYKKAEWEEEGAKLNAKRLRALTDAMREFATAEAEKSGEPVPAWVAMFSEIPKSEFGDLLVVFEPISKGKPSLERYDRWMGLKVHLGDDRPLDYRARLLTIKVKKAKGKDKGPPIDTMPAGPVLEEDAPKPAKVWYDLTCIPSPIFMIEWLKFEIFRYIQENLNFGLPCRAGPGLANWNFGEAKKWGMQDACGEKCVVFLSDRMKVRWVTRNADKEPVLYISGRTEQTGLHFHEYIYHFKIQMDKKENIQSIDHRLIKVYKNGEVQNLPRGTKLPFQDWNEFVEGEEDDASNQTL